MVGGGLVVNKPPANAGDIRDLGSVPRLRRSPEGGHDNPLLYSCLENLHGQKSLADYSPWACKESEATKYSTAQERRLSSGNPRA